jgi:hypothetical protein
MLVPFLIRVQVEDQSPPFSDPMLFCPLQGFRCADLDTQGVSVTQITFDDPVLTGIVEDGIKGARPNAFLTPVANIVVEHNHLRVVVPGKGLRGTRIHTRRILALLADNRIIPRPVFKLQEPDCREFVGEFLMMLKGAGQFAGPTACALLAIDHENVREQPTSGIALRKP